MCKMKIYEKSQKKNEDKQLKKVEVSRIYNTKKATEDNRRTLLIVYYEFLKNLS